MMPAVKLIPSAGSTAATASEPSVKTPIIANIAMKIAAGNCFAGFLSSLTCTAPTSMPAKSKTMPPRNAREFMFPKSGKKDVVSVDVLNSIGFPPNHQHKPRTIMSRPGKIVPPITPTVVSHPADATPRKFTSVAPQYTTKMTTTLNNLLLASSGSKNKYASAPAANARTVGYQITF